MDGSKHCFLFMMYIFGSNSVQKLNKVISLTFLLSRFVTLNCYYFESNLILVSHMKVLHTVLLAAGTLKLLHYLYDTSLKS